MDLIIVRHARPQRIENNDTGSPADPSLSELGVKKPKQSPISQTRKGRQNCVKFYKAVETAQPLSSMVNKTISQRDDLRESDATVQTVSCEEMTYDSAPFSLYERPSSSI